jgi:hypothetical protein
MKMIQTPGVSKIRMMLLSTPEGPKVRATVRLRPLSLKELVMSHLIAWDCINQYTIILNNPNHECSETTYTFGMSYENRLILVLLFSKICSC